MKGMTRAKWCFWFVFLILYVCFSCGFIPFPEVGDYWAYAIICWWFVMPGVLCWWAVLAMLRRDAVRHRLGWLWVMFAGPSVLQAFALGLTWCCLYGEYVDYVNRGGCPHEANSTLEMGSLIYITCFLGSCLPYVLTAAGLKWLFVPSVEDAEAPCA